MGAVHGADLLVRGRRVLTPGGVREASVHVRDGRIERLAGYDDVPGGPALVDAGDLVVLPGLVDTHVHVNDPGRTEWEGFATATRAAAAGGVTTIVDMPLNSIPPTTTLDALDVKRSTAEGSCHVEVGFWGGAVPDNLGRLRELHGAGTFGFKSFLCPSGVDEFPALDLGQLRAAMAEIAALDGLLLVHAELPGPIEEAAAALGDADPNAYRTYLSSRPAEAEERAIAEVVAGAAETGCRVHVLHVASADALGPMAGAPDGTITAETCPHYLTFGSEAIRDGHTQFKCAPPIREEDNRERLWDGLREGRLDIVVTDHSPSTPELKTGSFLDAWGGISSLQLGLRAMWTEARARGFGLEDLAKWMSQGPARIAGLRTKGAIAEGMDADLVLFDPERSTVCEPDELHFRHPFTPYAGRRLDGWVEATYVRGMRVYGDGGFLDAPAGRLLERGRA
jgi:allantoinase